LKDYCVAPEQRWIDGFVTEGGIVRQFVAAALGQGFTAEEQITGKADHGGIQIEVFPMKAEVYNRRFPPPPPPREEWTKGGIRPAGMRRALRGAGGMSAGSVRPTSYSGSGTSEPSLSFSGSEISEASGRIGATMDSMDLSLCREVDTDMGLAAGGSLEQQIFDDPYGLEDWDTEHGARVFVHLANSLVWKAITQQDPPHPPFTASDYSRRGYPWYDYYKDDLKQLGGTDKLAALKTLMQMGFQKGVQTVPENQPVAFKSDQILRLGDQRPDQVRSGTW
jgi:hypothetical protein